jgi:elongation factor Ts
LEVGCDTDFTVRTEQFQTLVRDTALHIAALAPTTLEQLLAQPFVKDTSHTVAEMYETASSTLSERIAVTRFIRWSTQDEEASPGGTPPRTPAVILSFRRSGS